MQSLFLTLLLLASHGVLSAAGLPVSAQQALDQSLRARGVKDAASLQAAAEAAFKEGASASELKAFLEQVPVQASAMEMEKGLKDMAGLLKEGLEDREARKAALLALRARLKAGAKGSDAKAAAVPTPSRDDKLRQSQAERREETRRRLGPRSTDAGIGPTPVHN